MTSTLLATRPWLAVLGLVVLVAALLVLGRCLVTAPRITLAAAVVAIAVVFAATFYPEQRQPGLGCSFAWAPPWAVEPLGNIVLFVAPVALITIRLGHPAIWLVAASGLSAVIEVVQASVPLIGRSCDASDWFANTEGALLGALVGMTVRIVHLRRGRSDSDRRFHPE